VTQITRAATYSIHWVSLKQVPELDMFESTSVEIDGLNSQKHKTMLERF